MLFTNPEILCLEIEDCQKCFYEDKWNERLQMLNTKSQKLEQLANIVNNKEI